MAIDEKDRKILEALLENSRQSFREIARKTGMSVVTVMKRAKALEKEGVITRYTSSLNYEKLGYDVDVLISIKVSHGQFQEVYSHVTKYDEIVAVYDVTGDFDVILVARFRNRRKLDAFLKKLQAFPHIERTHTVFILKILEKSRTRLAA